MADEAINPIKRLEGAINYDGADVVGVAEEKKN